MRKIETALITGASQGLGRALALALAGRGVRVALVARKVTALQKVEREIDEKGGTAFVIAADLADKRAIHPVAHQAAALLGSVDLLVNNASTLGPVPLQLLADTECEDFEAAIQLNLLAPFRLTKALLGQMVLRRSGLVVNISSDAAVTPYPTWGAYSATKAALEQLSRVWTAELEGSGVTVISVDPGEMNTKMHADAMPEADPAKLPSPEDAARLLLERIEL